MESLRVIINRFGVLKKASDKFLEPKMFLEYAVGLEVCGKGSVLKDSIENLLKVSFDTFSM